MYNLPYHKEQSEEAVREFVRNHPFALLTGCDAQGRPVATQVPVFLSERDGQAVLRGHIMRGTDHCEAFAENENVLVVFAGSHAYVSGTWYRNPHTASTWNYMSVHARGKIRFLEGDALIQILRETSLHFEGNDPSSTTTFDHLPKDFIEKAVKMIAAFEVEVTHLDSVFKLSQDRDQESYRNIIEKLKGQGDAARDIAAAMENKMAEVFPKDGGA